MLAVVSSLLLLLVAFTLSFGVLAVDSSALAWSAFDLFFFLVGSAGRGRSLISSQESIFRIGGSHGLYCGCSWVGVFSFLLLFLSLLTLPSVISSQTEWSDDCTGCLFWSLKEDGNDIFFLINFYFHHWVQKLVREWKRKKNQAKISERWFILFHFYISCLDVLLVLLILVFC